MNAMVKYFLKLIEHHMPDGFLVFTNFMMDRYGHKVWIPEDVGDNFKKVTIIGVDDYPYHKSFFNFSLNDNENTARSSAFDISWSKWGSFSIELEGVNFSRNAQILLKSAFLQMLNMSNNGMNVFLGSKCFIKRNTAYEHLVKIDMIDSVE